MAVEWIVKDGRPNAEIVIAEQPARTVRLAAADLQAYIEKISDAHLPIVTSPSGDKIRLLVGRSPYTDELGITAEGLRYGAYRLVSGNDWMVFLGDDTDFVPREPYPRSHAVIASGELQKSWEAAAGGPWKAPDTVMWKDRDKVPAAVGLPDSVSRPGKNAFFVHWAYDEQGSFNAVSAFLRQLGVRWLMPGELGEFVPKMKSVSLTKIDKTVRPDFEIRQFSVHGPSEWTRWGMRLGVRYPYGMSTAHGMSRLGTEEIFQSHPDWFAMYGGERKFDPEDTNNHFCYSSKGLFDETVRCVRAQFDVYDYEGVSVMPPDAYISICQCEKCRGKDTPGRPRGTLSNHVWEFVNRVAKEVSKTHPGKLIYCCAYGENSLPPTNIKKLEPNVQVVIVGGRRPKSGIDQQNALRAFRESWLPLTDRPIQIYENYPLTSRGTYLPIFMARVIGNSINETKGYSRGEEVWVSPYKKLDGFAMFNHFAVYFSAQAYWGGKQHDVGKALDEYCRLMYGTASEAMKGFFDYCEVNWQAMEADKEKADTALAMFDTAKAMVPPTSREGQRLALIDDYLSGLRNKSLMLAQKRGQVPKLRLVGEPKDIVIDGRLDELFWQDWHGSPIGRFRELQTGDYPTFGTQVKVGWSGSDLYFALRCQDMPGDELNITATKDGDRALWYGDAVEFLIATDSHSYYQIAVNPAGVIVDFDRGADKDSWDSWDSKAEAATRVTDNGWDVEIRIPITDDGNDPLHRVVGRKPTASLPWFFNICRQRVRKNGTEYSAFSPTGTSGFHHPLRFAHLHGGLSHTFDFDPGVKTYMTAAKAAANLPREQRAAAYLALADGAEGELTDFQKASAFKLAAQAARSMREYERADAITSRIPIESVRKSAEMLNLLAKRKPQEVVLRYGSEDLDEWPCWAAGEGYYARGRAYDATGNPAKAMADYKAALQLTGESRLHSDVVKLLEKLGKNR